MALIGISGKIGSGKDTVGKIIQILTASPHFTNTGVLSFLNREIISPYEIKKFADKLKDTLCLWIGCTREQLEDPVFKNKELPEMWWYYKVKNVGEGYTLVDYLNNEESEEWLKIANPRFLIKPTPRLLLQLVGTECGRDIIHPNMWVNALFSEYTPDNIYNHAYTEGNTDYGLQTLKYPSWIITDMRFPNELKAVIENKGITIRVNSKWVHHPDNKHITANRDNQHISETALDNYDCKHTIYNNGTIEELIEIVKEILIEEKII